MTCGACILSVVQMKTYLFYIDLSQDENVMTFRSWQMKKRDTCDNRSVACCMSIISLLSWDFISVC